MQQIIKKPILYSLLMLMLGVTSLMANNTMFPGCLQLSANVKTTVLQFQYLRGSNRIAESNKTYHFLFINTSDDNTNHITNATSAKINSFNDFKKMWGQPNQILTNGD